jgi:riboflavin kinase / FMN adenylyltransferase
MRIFHEIPANRNEIQNAVVTIGTFDGVHKGHQYVLRTLKEEAVRQNGDPVVVTFSNHPREVLEGAKYKALTTSDEKVREIFSLGIDTIILLTFTEKMSRISAEEFLSTYLVGKLDIQALVMGYDHAFGRNREGNSGFIKNFLKPYDIKLIEANEVDFQGLHVSSSEIRRLMVEGDVSRAAVLLGRFYSIRGHVVKGRGIGRTIGFPTANIELNSESKMVPPHGVYGVKVLSDTVTQTWGVCNIGMNPTFGGTKTTVEVFIPGLDSDIYGIELELQFVEKIRDERNFPAKDDLVEQIKKDILNTQRILNSIGE